MKGVQRRVKWWLWAIEVCTTNLLPVSFSFACHHLNRRKLTEICCNIFSYQVFSTNISYFYTISKLKSNSQLSLMNIFHVEPKYLVHIALQRLFINFIWVDRTLGQLLEISRNLRAVFYTTKFCHQWFKNIGQLSRFCMKSHACSLFTNSNV